MVHQIEGSNGRLVEPPERDPPPIGAPAKCVAQVQLFLVHPIRGAVNHVLAAVGGERRLRAGGEIGDVEVVVAHEADHSPVGRELGELLVAGAGAHRREALPRQVPHVEGALGVLPPDAGRVCEQEQLRAVRGKAVFLDHNRLPAPGRDQVGAANQQLLRPRERIDLIQIGIAGSVLLDGRVRLAVLHPGYVHEIARVLARAPNRMDGERRRLNALGGQGLDERDDGADGEEPVNHGWNHDGTRGRLGVPQTYPPGPIVEDWTDARFGSTFPTTFLFHRWDGAH